jgi:RND superfamily putative drug exporter
VFLIAAFLQATLFEDVITTEFEITNNPESSVGKKLIEEKLTGPKGTNEVVIVQSQEFTVDDSEFEGIVNSIHTDVAVLGPDIIRQETLLNYFDTPADFLVSQDRHTIIIPFTMAGDVDDASDHIEEVADVVDTHKGDSNFKVLMVGQATVGLDFQEVAQEGLLKGEIVGVPIALLILVLVLGAVVAAVIPLIMAVVAIVLALGLASLAGQGFELSFFVENMITMIGLAVGIDYSLFFLSRYREERSKGLDKLEAIARAGATANRTVVFSGIAVVLGFIGLLLVPSNVFIGIGLAVIFVVVASVLAALTLLPAILGLMGDRINKLSIPLVGKAQTRFDESHPGGFWDRMSRTVMGKPVISLVLAGGVLIAAVVVFFDINTGAAGVATFPDGIESKEGFQILDREFSAGEVTPAEIVIDGDINSPEVQAAIGRLTVALETDALFSQPKPLTISEDGEVGLLVVPVGGDSASQATINSIKRLRSEHVPSAFQSVPAQVFVTGETALNIDFFDMAKDAAKLVIPFVLAVSFVLLMIMFRSIVVPIKAIILNLISVGATYGILVLVFQKGVLADALGFQQAETIEAWIPIFLFAIIFGLSMDYHVFLLSRVRERFDQTQDNTESIAFGIRSTGRLITGAALIMVAVFFGFAVGDLVPLQQMGFGLGIAILLDATIVRMVLVPASMKLLGNWNWYLPKWLEWLPDPRVEPLESAPAPAGSDD